MKLFIFNMLFLTATTCLFSSCAIPASKERYITNFERFVVDVEKNAGKFKPKDWQWANRRYRLYSDEWYEKFKPELTVKEQLEVTALRIRFQAAKETRGIRRKTDQGIKEDLDRMGEDVGKYLDENLDKDLEKLGEGAREIGDSAAKVVEDLVKELRKEKRDRSGK